MPPLSEMEVMGRVLQLSSVSTTAWLVEPEEESKCSPMIVARERVIPDERRVPVRLLNPRNEPVNLRKGDQIAVMEPLPVDIANIVAAVNDAIYIQSPEQVLWQMVSKSEDKLTTEKTSNSSLYYLSLLTSLQWNGISWVGLVRSSMKLIQEQLPRFDNMSDAARTRESSKLIKDMLKKEVIRPTASISHSSGP